MFISPLQGERNFDAGYRGLHPRLFHLLLTATHSSSASPRFKNSYLNTASSPTPSSTSPSLFSGDVFFFFNVSISLSWAAITPSFAAIVSFFAATVSRRDTASALRVSFSSNKTCEVRFSVSRRSRKRAFSRSSASARMRVLARSSTAAAQELIRSWSLDL